MPPFGPPPPTPGSAFLSLPTDLVHPDLIPLSGQVPERPPEPEAPTWAEIQQLADRLQSRWQPLHQRMDLDYRMYRLVLDKQEGEGERVILNTPYTSVEKLANMLGSAVPQIEKDFSHDGLRSTAQKVKNLLMSTLQEWSDEWMRCLHGPLERDIAHFAALRGWIAGRVEYDPLSALEPGANPVRFTPLDPRNLYVHLGTRGIRAVVHRYRATVGELLDEWPQVSEILGISDDPWLTYEVIAYYDAYYHAVYINGQEIKAPTAHGYGFVPIRVVTCNGAPIRWSGYAGTDASWVSEVGPSCFHGSRVAYSQLNRLYSQLANVVAEASDPPLLVKHDPERKDEPEKLKLTPGAVNYLWNTESVEPIRKSPNPGDVGPLAEALTKNLEQATIPEVLWGAGGDQSGFAIALLSGAAKDATFGILRALEAFYADILECSLKLLSNLHDGPIGVMMQDRRGDWVGGETVTPQDIQLVGTRVRVKFRDIAPKDRGALAQLAIQLTHDKLISLETARTEYLGLENPDRENDRVLNDLVYQDPNLMQQLLVPLSLYRNNPELFEVWVAMQAMQAQQQQQQQMMQTMGGAPGGPPAGPSGPGAPGPLPAPGAGHAPGPPVPGTPPMPVPAPMAPNHNPFDHMAHAQASAHGGAGVPPPIPLRRP